MRGLQGLFRSSAPWVVALLLGGCPRPAPELPVGLDPDPPPPEEPAAAGTLETRPFTDEERAQSKDKLGGAWVRCYRRFQPEGDPPADLARLAEACGPPAGLTAVTPVRIGEAQAQDDPSERFAFRARAGRCYRFFAVGVPEVADLDVAVLDPEGRLAAADASRDRFPIVPPRGPLCVEREGVYTVEAAVIQGSGRFVLQVWGD